MKIPRSSPPGTFWPGSGRLKNHGPDQPVWAVFLWTLVQQNPEIGDGALRRVAADNFPRRAVPADNAHDSLQQIVTSLPRPPGCPRWQCARQLSANRYFPAPPGIVTGLKNAQTKAPLVKGGWFGEAKPGGFRRLAGFHIGLYFKRVPAVNPSGTCGASSLWQGSLWDVPLHEPGGLYTCLPIS